MAEERVAGLGGVGKPEQRAGPQRKTMPASAGEREPGDGEHLRMGDDVDEFTAGTGLAGAQEAQPLLPSAG